MKTIAEVRDSIVKGVLMERNMGDKQIDQILREYAESIVEECMNNFECTMEWDNSMHPDGVVREHPVLVRASIEAVKKQIV